MKRFLISILLTVVVCVGKAQQYEGYVISDESKPLKGVSIILLDEKEQTLSFAKTKDNGEFAISHEGNGEVAYIVFSCMGYERDTINVDNFEQGKAFMLFSKTFEIKEVTVRSQRIMEHGDTLDYSISSFMQKQDRTLSDVLKNMPGISVTSDGRILFQDKPINNFYIEGMNLMGDNYSLASENLAAKKVKKVQVLKNHQPIKMLRDMSFSDAAAINIVLQDDIKNTIQLAADLSAGSTMQGKTDVLGNEGLIGMLFSKSKQSFNIYKFDNTGENLYEKQEIIDMIEIGRTTRQQLLINDLSTLSPNIDDKRSRFNRSHLVNSNWLWKNKTGNELRFQLNAFTDRNEGNLTQHTAYKDIGDMPEIYEKRDVVRYNTRMHGDLLYNVNSENVFLDNNLRVSGMFGHARANTTLYENSVREHVKPGEFDITNNIEYRRKIKNDRSYSLSSSLGYNYQTGKLLLIDKSLQTHNLQTFKWTATASHRKKISHFVMSNKVSASIISRNLGLYRSGYNVRHGYFTSCMAVSPELTYSKGSFKTTFALPLTFDIRHFNHVNKKFAGMSPKLSVTVKPMKDIEIRANYSYSTEMSGFAEVDTIPIFSAYNSMIKGLGRFNKTYNSVTELHTTYKNMPAGIFASVMCQYNATYNNVVYERSYVNGFFLSEPTDMHSNNHGFNLLGRMEKTFSWGHTILSSTFSIRNNHYAILYGGKLVPAMFASKSFSLKFKTQPLEWLSVSITNVVKDQIQKGRRDHGIIPETSFTTNNLMANLYIMPGEWQFEVRNSFEYCTHDGIPNAFFTDISLSWRPQKFEIGLFINNIWGKYEYTTSVISNTQYTLSHSRLRNREIMIRFALGI